MTELKAQNRKENRVGNRKILVAVVCIAVLAALLVIALVSKNQIYFSAAQRKAAKGDYAYAMELAEKSGSKETEILEKYIALRIDINSSYPDLLADFDFEKIKQWSETAAEIIAQGDLVGEAIAKDAAALSQTLGIITDGITGYEAIRADVLSMMDVFLEINRLHSKGEDGKNIGFTVEEERKKISMWEQQCSAVEEYARTVDSAENIYLLNYLIKEVQGECSDLSDAIDSVIESGYSETDRVRFSGETRKNYPDIRSSNASVNLLEKDNYELYVYKGICRALVENLGEFYIP